jgi:hypothetical protein
MEGQVNIALTEQESQHLAWRIAASHLRNTESWLEWEDYPELDERSFERLDSSVHNVAAWLLEQSLRRDFDSNIDSAHLLELTQ